MVRVDGALLIDPTLLFFKCICYVGPISVAPSAIGSLKNSMFECGEGRWRFAYRSYIIVFKCICCVGPISVASSAMGSLKNSMFGCGEDR